MITLTLMPLKKNSQPKARKARGKTFLTITQSFFLEITTYLKDIKEIHAFIMKSFLLFQKIDKAVKVLEAVKPLLQEFQEVILDKLLDELPLMHDI